MVAAYLPFKKILCTTDLSAHSSAAFEYAIDEARASNGQIALLTIVEGFQLPLHLGDWMPPSNEIEALADAAEQRAKQLIDRAAAEHFQGVQIACEVMMRKIGATGDLIADYAAAHGFDLIVMAAQGHGMLERILLGSVAERVLRRAACPVLIVPVRAAKSGGVGHHPPARKIVLTTDLSESSRAAIPAALYEQKRNGAALTVLHVLEQLIAPDLLSATPEALAHAMEVQSSYKKTIEDKVRGFVPAGDGTDFVVVEKNLSIAHAVDEYARTHGAELIVLSTRGAGGRLHFMGGVAERVLRHAPCPVLMVPHAAAG